MELGPTYEKKTESTVNLLEGESEHENLDVMEVENVTILGVPPVVENYIYRGWECKGMSVYEMITRTEVTRMVVVQKEKYENRGRDQDGRSRNNGGFTQKVLFMREHSKAQSQWISFNRSDKTPVIYGKSNYS